MAVYRDWSSQDSGICPSDSVIAPPPREPLAVIGLAGRFSGDASNSTKLWQMLLEQRSAAGPVPKSRFDADSYYHPDPDHGGTSATKDGYFLDGDIHAFDTSLFNLTANEVASMDAQQKLLLENVFHALENGMEKKKMQMVHSLITLADHALDILSWLAVGSDRWLAHFGVYWSIQ